jgi:hypothetical protein
MKRVSGCSLSSRWIPILRPTSLASRSPWTFRPAAGSLLSLLSVSLVLVLDISLTVHAFSTYMNHFTRLHLWVWEVHTAQHWSREVPVQSQLPAATARLAHTIAGIRAAAWFV